MERTVGSKGARGGQEPRCSGIVRCGRAVDGASDIPAGLTPQEMVSMHASRLLARRSGR